MAPVCSLFGSRQNDSVYNAWQYAVIGVDNCKFPRSRIVGETAVLCFVVGCLSSVFTARAYARAVLGVVILSVCLSVRLSVCHTRAL